MAIIFGWIAIVGLVSLTLMQVIYVWIYCRFLQTRNDADATLDRNESDYPVTAVILCLRGADPSLRDCLAGILAQDVEAYELHIVVDDEHDPAMKWVHELDREQNKVAIATHVFDPELTDGCSLKCAALTSVIAALDDAVEVIVLIDADTIVDPKWLSDLLKPLADPSVGATTGNRWFAPDSLGFGSLVRQVWNAAAVPQMSFYEIAWGGSLAIKRSTIEKCNLVTAWNSAFCEDTMMASAMAPQRLRLVRVPGLIVPNHESTSLRGAYRWISRQLLAARLYHPRWPWVLAHGVLAAICLIGSVIAACILFAEGNVNFGWVVFATMVGYQIVNGCLIRAIQRENELAVGQRGVSLKVTKTNFLLRLLAIFATQLVHPAAVISAAFTRNVSWRGIDYRIGKDNAIKRGPYQPYRDIGIHESDSQSEQESIE